MSLPIPYILQNAAEVIKLARALDDKTKDLADALKKVHESDVEAVMNEVGKVYTSLYHMHARELNIGITHDKKALVISVDFGFRKVEIPLIPEEAENVLGAFQNALNQLKPNGLIVSMSGA